MSQNIKTMGLATVQNQHNSSKYKYEYAVRVFNHSYLNQIKFVYVMLHDHIKKALSFAFVMILNSWLLLVQEINNRCINDGALARKSGKFGKFSSKHFHA